DRYEKFFLSEFLPYVETHFRIIRDRRHRGVTGLSMGGFGALRFAFAHPEVFGSVSAQSPALITETPQQVNADLRDAGPLARVLGNAFGTPVDVAHWNANNPLNLAQRNRIALKTEAIYFNCGEQDEFGFAEGASKLHKQLTAMGLLHEFHLYPGSHDAKYFLSYLHETMEFHWKAFTTKRLHRGVGMRKAILHLKKSDPVMRGIIERIGPCRMKFGEPVFHSLAEAIIYQQLNGRAAETIF